MSRPSFLPPLRHPLLAVAVLALVVAAGCIGKDDPLEPVAAGNEESRAPDGPAVDRADAPRPDRLATDGEEPPALPFVYPCGPGAAEARVPNVCVTRIENGTHQLSEPSLALHPDDPDIMAVGVHLMGPESVLPNASLISGRVYVTEDGGATWRASDLPLPAESAPGSLYSDPALAFAPDGALHGSGLLLQPALGGRFAVDVFAVASRDLGRTWEPSVLLTEDGRNDRNWQAVGPDGIVYVTSHVCCTTTKAHWSEDGGRTWRGLEATPDGCYTGSPVAFVGGEPWLACSHGGDKEVRLFRLDRVARVLEPRSAIPDMDCIAPRILQGPDGALTVTCYSGLIARSVDGGATWGDVESIGDIASVEDGWPHSFQVYWSEVDARNVLHLQLATLHRPDVFGWLGGQPHRLAHVALDAPTLAVLHEARLTPETPERDHGTPGALLPPLGDDWYGIAFHPDGQGMMVWTWAGGVDIARFEPAPEGRAD